MEGIFPVVLYTAMAASAGVILFIEPRLQGWRRRRRVWSWRTIAEKHGLDWHGERISGWLGAYYVAVWPESWQAGGVTHGCVAVAIWPPLDLGFTMWTDDPSPEYRVSSDDERGRLLDHELRQLLSRRPPATSVKVTDDWLLLSPWQIPTPKQLDEMLAYVTEVARAIDELRAKIPPSPVINGVAADWRAFAKERRWVMTATPFGFAGSVQRLNVRVFCKRVARGQFAAAAHAAFGQPLHIGFRARMRQSQGETPWSMEPFTVGDPEFDAAFAVDAFERKYVSVAFNERARARLLEVARGCHDVVVDDYGVLLQAQLVGRDGVRMLLDDALSIAVLVDFVHPKLPASAYR